MITEVIDETVVQKIRNVKDFLKQQNTKDLEIQNEIKNLKLRIKTEALQFNRTVLFSIPFEETLVSFGPQQPDALFNGKQVPEEGLFLREVQIIFVKSFNEDSVQYATGVGARFLMSDSDFDYTISFGRVAFDDEELRISEQVMGVGYNPRFKNKAKFEQLKKAINEIREKMK